jgi:hypothetical protein
MARECRLYRKDAKHAEDRELFTTEYAEQAWSRTSRIFNRRKRREQEICIRKSGGKERRKFLPHMGEVGGEQRKK